MRERNWQRTVFAGLVGAVVALGTGPAGWAAPASKGGGVPFEDLRVFAEVFGRIKSDYVERVPDKRLIEEAIEGMLTGLDPHSSYLNEDEYRELRVGTSGEFGGVGIEVGMEDGLLKVIATDPSTRSMNSVESRPWDWIRRVSEASSS